MKPQFQHKNIRQPIIEEEKEQMSDFDQTYEEDVLKEDIEAKHSVRKQRYRQ